MAQQSFTAQIDAWVATTKDRTEAVFKESAQRVVETMQKPVAAGGNMPVETGFLRASLRTTLNSPASGSIANPGNPVQYDDGSVALAINGAELGDTIYAVYTAKYARRSEYGFVGEDSLGRTYNQVGRGFVRLAAQQWPQIVDQVANEAQSRSQKP
jgi:hypothetical protein